MPPPGPLNAPLVMVSPEMVTVLPGLMWNTRPLALPFTARTFAPGPLMVTLLPTTNCPLVSVIVPVTETSELTVSPSFASASRLAQRARAAVTCVHDDARRGLSRQNAGKCEANECGND